jgi:hypothetical protein
MTADVGVKTGLDLSRKTSTSFNRKRTRAKVGYKLAARASSAGAGYEDSMIQRFLYRSTTCAADIRGAEPRR